MNLAETRLNAQALRTIARVKAEVAEPVGKLAKFSHMRETTTHSTGTVRARLEEICSNRSLEVTARGCSTIGVKIYYQTSCG